MLLGLGLRLVRLDFGEALPYLAHPDEPTQYDAASRILRTGDPNPRFFNYPSLYLYVSTAALGLGAVALEAAGEIEGFGDLGSVEAQHVGIGLVPYPELLLLGRVMSALIGTLTIGLLMLLVRTLCTSAWAPSLAGLALALSPEHIRLSHYLTVDVPAAALLVASLAACVSPVRFLATAGGAHATQHGGILGWAAAGRRHLLLAARRGRATQPDAMSGPVPGGRRRFLLAAGPARATQHETMPGQAHGGERRLLWAAVLAGLSSSTKYNYAVAFAAVATAALLGRGGVRDRLVTLLLAGMAFAAAFIVTSPYVLLDLPAAWAGISEEVTHYASGDAGVAGSSALWYLAWLWREAPACLLLGLGGLVIAARRDPLAMAPVAVFAIVFAVLIAAQKFHVSRAALPLLVLLMGGAALAVEGAVSSAGRWTGGRHAARAATGGALAVEGAVQSARPCTGVGHPPAEAATEETLAVEADVESTAETRRTFEARSEATVNLVNPVGPDGTARVDRGVRAAEAATGVAFAVEGAVEAPAPWARGRRAYATVTGAALAVAILLPGLANLPGLLFSTGPSARAQAQAWFDAALASEEVGGALDRSQPDAVKILAEGYTVFLRPETTDVTYRRTVSDHDLASYALHGYDLIVVGSGMSDRFVRYPEHFPERAARYREYFDRLSVVRSFTSPRDPLQFGDDDPAVHVFVLTARGHRFVEAADRAAAASPSASGIGAEPAPRGSR